MTDFGGALDALESQPGGSWMLGLTAVGLMAFGAFAFVEARWRRIRPPRDLDAAAARVVALLKSAPAVDTDRVPKVADMQRRTLAVYDELINGSAPDPSCVLLR